MECNERLRLIRALYALSQQELAGLVKTGRTFIGAIEEGRKALPEQLAEAISDRLHVDAGWLVDTHWQQPLQGAHLLILEFPPRKVLAAARNIRALRLNDAMSTIEKLWPLFLEENPPRQCWVAEVDDDTKILLLLFDSGQGMLMKLAGVQSLAKTILEAVERRGQVDISPVALSMEHFDEATKDRAIIPIFLKRCGLTQDLLHRFSLAADNILPAHATQVNELTRKTRKSIVEKLGEEMIENDISTAEIEDFLRSRGHTDLIKAASHSPE